MTSSFTESVVEDAALAWLKAFGYAVLHGPGIAAGKPGAECSDPNYRDVIPEHNLAVYQRPTQTQTQFTSKGMHELQRPARA